MKYDSAHLKFKADIKQVDDKHISVNGQKIRVFTEKDPSKIKWGDLKT